MAGSGPCPHLCCPFLRIPSQLFLRGLTPGLKTSLRGRDRAERRQRCSPPPLCGSREFCQHQKQVAGGRDRRPTASSEPTNPRWEDLRGQRRSQAAKYSCFQDKGLKNANACEKHSESVSEPRRKKGVLPRQGWRRGFSLGSAQDRWADPTKTGLLASWTSSTGSSEPTVTDNKTADRRTLFTQWLSESLPALSFWVLLA